MRDLDGDNLLTFRDFERDLHDRSPRTLQSYREAACQLAEHFGGRDLLSLRKADVLGYLIHVRQTRSPATELVRYRSLRRFYNWAVSEELINRSPLHGTEQPSVEEKEIPVPEADVIRALLKACQGRDHDSVRDTAIIRLFCEPGAPRLAEMASIRVEHLDMVRDQVEVLGKGAKWRTIPFGAKTGKALTRYLRVRAAHPLARLPLLWLGARGQPLTANGIAQMLRRRCDEAGIKRIHPHQLRHFAADLWFGNDGDIQDGMRLFGWESLEMPLRYARANSVKRAIAAHRRKALGDLL
jgi:site-specific recombinase XerC